MFLLAPALHVSSQAFCTFLWKLSTEQKYLFQIITTSTQPCITIFLTIIKVKGTEIAVVTATLFITGNRTCMSHRFEITLLISPTQSLVYVPTNVQILKWRFYCGCGNIRQTCGWTRGCGTIEWTCGLRAIKPITLCSDKFERKRITNNK